MATNAISDMLRQKPNKKSKKGGAKGSVAFVKEFIQLVCVSQDSMSEKFYSTERRKIAPRARDAKKKQEKCKPHERGPCSRQESKGNESLR